jgi:hypothetical protein
MIVRLRSALHEQTGLERLGQVAPKGGQPPLGSDARLAAQRPMASLFDKAELNQLLEGPSGGVSVDNAFTRRVANGERYLAIVGAVVPDTDRQIDGARRRAQAPPSFGPHHVVMHLEISVRALVAFLSHCSDPCAFLATVE